MYPHGRLCLKKILFRPNLLVSISIYHKPSVPQYPIFTLYHPFTAKERQLFLTFSPHITNGDTVSFFSHCSKDVSLTVHKMWKVNSTFISQQYAQTTIITQTDTQTNRLA